MFVSEPICPYLKVENGLFNSENCLSNEGCKVGAELSYTWETGFVVSFPTTTCQQDHTWSETPICKRSNDVLIECFCSYINP